jgi:hypothetical protein
MTTETIEREQSHWETPEFKARVAARKRFSVAHAAWISAEAELANLNASPDIETEAEQEAFDESISLVDAKREVAIEAILDAPTQDLGQLLQKFTIIESLFAETKQTVLPTDSPLFSLVTSIKSDVVRLLTAE